MTSEVLSPPVAGKLSRLIEEALYEDIGLGDITTESIVPNDLLSRAEIVAKARGVIAGLEIAGLVFRNVDPNITLSAQVPEGNEVEPGTIVATVEGPAASILKGERTALNFLQRMSGIATLTREFVKRTAHTTAKITDTRKTAPSLRIIDKLAVEIGGGVNHRFGLDDMVLVKDNHIAIAGGISPAIEKCLKYIHSSNRSLKIEVEAKNLDEVRKILKHSGIHRIMLDNFSLADTRKAVQFINHSVEIEASGNVTLETVRAIAETGVEYISIGALTHSPKALDVSLEIAQTFPPS